MRPTSRLDDCALPSTAKLIGGAFEASKVFGQSVDKTFTAGEIGIRNGIADAALRGVTSSAITQGVAVATGLQDKFNWAGVAAAGVAAGVGQWAGGGLPSLQTDTNITNIASHAGASMASLIASAATRSAIEGSGFGDNIRAGLPDVIGQAIGSALAGAIVPRGPADYDPKNLEKYINSPDFEGLETDAQFSAVIAQRVARASGDEEAFYRELEASPQLRAT